MWNRNLDALLVAAALTALVALGLATGTPVFEPFGAGRLTFGTVLAVPLVLAYALLRARGRLALRRSLRFGLDWAPVLGLLAVYESLKHMHANRITIWLGIAPKDGLMLAADELLFGKALPLYLEWMAVPWFERVMWFAYLWIYYLAPVVVLGWAYACDTALFFRLRRALVCVLLGGYVSYILVPVAGPLFVIGDQFRVPIGSQPILGRLAFSTLRYNWDCFPSLHTAVPWLLTLVAWPRLRPWARGVAIVASVAVTLSTVVLRFHYGVDLVAGVAWAWIVWKVSLVTAPGLVPAGHRGGASSGPALAA